MLLGDCAWGEPSFIIWGGIHGAGLVIDKLRFKYLTFAILGYRRYSRHLSRYMLHLPDFLRAASMLHIKDMLSQISTHLYWLKYLKDCSL
jgi:hypothetical protein